jgi:HD superfamily phosphohydrolase YqeK
MGLTSSCSRYPTSHTFPNRSPNDKKARQSLDRITSNLQVSVLVSQSIQFSIRLYPQYSAMCPPSDLATTRSLPPYPNLESIVPQTEVSKAAYAHATDLLHPAILNHSIRVYLYATALASHTSSKYSTGAFQHDLLFTACLFHDIGTTEKYDGPQRFEVEGADAAVKHLSQYAVSEVDAHEVWTAIACHTSPGIAEHIGELSRIVRIAVITDFGRKSAEGEVLAPLREEMEARFERKGVEKVLSDAVVEQAKGKPEKAPKVSWPHAMVKAWETEPGWEGVNKAF